MRRLVALTSVLAWAVMCSTASASIVSMVTEEAWDRHTGTYLIYSVSVVAGAGERNQVELSLSGDDTRVRDSAGVTPVAPCVADDAQTARCPTGAFPGATVDLGDGDDTMSHPPEFRPRGLEIEGGSGSDFLTASRGLQKGGPGDDRIVGGVAQGGPGADVLDAEAVDYSDHVEGVTFDFAGGVAGARGENDQVWAGVKTFRGGSGPDVVRAASAPVRVYGGPGDDVIDGGPADDDLNGGSGNDVIHGHEGDDGLADYDDFAVGAPPSGDDQLYGGPGNDGLSSGAGADLLDGGPGTDRLDGGLGPDVLLSRDGHRETLLCTPDVLEGDRVTVDRGDRTTACEHIDRSDARSLEVHGFKMLGPLDLRFVLSCPRAAPRTCRAIARFRGFYGYKRTSRVRIAPGREVRLHVHPRQTANEGYTVRLVLPTGETLRALLYRAGRGGPPV